MANSYVETLQEDLILYYEPDSSKMLPLSIVREWFKSPLNLTAHGILITLNIPSI